MWPSRSMFVCTFLQFGLSWVFWVLQKHFISRASYFSAYPLAPLSSLYSQSFHGYWGCPVRPSQPWQGKLLFSISENKLAVSFLFSREFDGFSPPVSCWDFVLPLPWKNSANFIPLSVHFIVAWQLEYYLPWKLVFMVIKNCNLCISVSWWTQFLHLKSTWPSAGVWE